MLTNLCRPQNATVQWTFSFSIRVLFPKHFECWPLLALDLLKKMWHQRRHYLRLTTSALTIRAVPISENVSAKTKSRVNDQQVTKQHVNNQHVNDRRVADQRLSYFTHDTTVAFSLHVCKSAVTHCTYKPRLVLFDSWTEGLTRVCRVLLCSHLMWNRTASWILDSGYSFYWRVGGEDGVVMFEKLTLL